MSYLNSIMDALMEVHIFEMAYQRKVIVNKVRDLSLHIAEHVNKIALWSDNSARKHWEKEIHAALANISKLRYDGTKRLKSDEYFNLLYIEPFERSDLIQSVSKEGIRNGMFDLKWKESDFDKIDKKIKTVYTELSKQISDNKYIHISYNLENAGI